VWVYCNSPNTIINNLRYKTDLLVFVHVLILTLTFGDLFECLLESSMYGDNIYKTFVSICVVTNSYKTCRKAGMDK